MLHYDQSGAVGMGCIIGVQIIIRRSMIRFSGCHRRHHNPVSQDKLINSDCIFQHSAFLLSAFLPDHSVKSKAYIFPDIIIAVSRGGLIELFFSVKDGWHIVVIILVRQ